jgi:hypothetical protein
MTDYLNAADHEVDARRDGDTWVLTLAAPNGEW